MSEGAPIPTPVPPATQQQGAATRGGSRNRNRRGGGRGGSSVTVSGENGIPNSEGGRPASAGGEARRGGGRRGRGGGAPGGGRRGGGAAGGQGRAGEGAGAGVQATAGPSVAIDSTNGLDQPPHVHQHDHSPYDHSADVTPPNERSRPLRQQNARRARFNAALSTTLTSLTANATPFVAAAPTPFQHPTASPASETLLSRLTTELSNGTYDCSICFSSLSRTTSIHSCPTCYTSFHLSCISKWATTSVTSSAERAVLLASRNPSASASSLAGHWRCPGCQTSFDASAVPKTYRCFCQRVRDPPHRPPATPHSCGQQCARPRPEGCKHQCQIECHPGPCPPCGVVLGLRCHCGKKGMQVRCSAINGSKSEGGREELLSCKAPCGRKLGCGLHECARDCHEGACGECEEVREKRCFCGKDMVVEACGAGMDERVECCRPGEEERWDGEWSCAKDCEAPYDCGHHTCKLRCHPHTSSTPLACPLSPSTLTTCPCGTTLLSVLLPSPRTSCLSPVPTCARRCPKIHNCGHECRKPCHPGDCGTCDEMVSIVCRCGTTKSTRRCGDRAKDGGELEELLCDRVCRAMRSCGRHECGRKCCPLAYQEAIRASKSRRRPLAEVFDAESDPMGLHLCERTCGRKLSCGQHLCQAKDHKGPCPPCLLAGFDELICHCGSTVVLPPIACNTQIDCRHPCIRASACGHPQMPHACHEDPVCPPCPFLMEKPCACGKKRLGNIRCSQDLRRVSCGTPCGKLLRCGFHRCRKTCHVAGECENCDQICLKPRKICSHPCPEQCHAPSACPVDSPCPKLIDVTCACGHLKQRARCATSASRPEGNRDRFIKCTDMCVVAKRNAALAEALGIEKKEAKVKEVEYEVTTLSFYAANLAWCTAVETSLVEFVKSDKQALHLPVMKLPQRQFTHELAELFDLRSESLDEEPRRSVVVHRQSTSGIPTPNLADAFAAQRKSASTLLTFNSLRKALPERSPNNALFLEGVLGYDEAMLKDILRPQMRGLKFVVSWVAEEDVLVTFDYTSIDLESKIHSIQNALRTLSEDTGFCATIEGVTLADDGKITRGSWTPVAGSSSSRLSNLNSAPVFSTNAFAALGGGGDSKTTPAPRLAHAWGSGSIIGPAHNKPPRAVVGSSSLERPPPPPVQPRETLAPRSPPPENWEEEEEEETETAARVE